MRAIVVGGGLAGLGAAIELARSDVVVELWEPRALGGRARSERRAEALVNLGAHALYRAGAAARALSEWGVTVSGAPPRRGLFMLDAASLHPLPTGAWSLATCGLLGWGERIDLARFLTRPPEPARGESALEYVNRLGSPSSRRVGCAAGEAHGDAALLRSVATAPRWRRRGVAASLVDLVLVGLEGRAVYAFAEAPRYFETLGFVPIDRSALPDSLASSAQAGELCRGATLLRLRR